MSASSRWCELRTQTVDHVVSSQTTNILPRQALDKRVRTRLQNVCFGNHRPHPHQRSQPAAGSSNTTLRQFLRSHKRQRPRQRRRTMTLLISSGHGTECRRIIAVRNRLCFLRFLRCACSEPVVESHRFSILYPCCVH